MWFLVSRAGQIHKGTEQFDNLRQATRRLREFEKRHKKKSENFCVRLIEI